MFEISRQGAVQVLSGDLPLNAEHAAEVATLCAESVGRGQSRMVLDFKKIPLIDSAGLELLLTLRDDCLRGGGSLQLANLGTTCRDILVATGVVEHFAVFDNLDTAVGSYA